MICNIFDLVKFSEGTHLLGVSSFGNGLMFNLQYTILCNRMQPHLLALSYSLCFGIASLFSALLVVLIQNLCYLNICTCSLCILGMIVTQTLNNKHQQIPAFLRNLQDIQDSIMFPYYDFEATNEDKYSEIG